MEPSKDKEAQQVGHTACFSKFQEPPPKRKDFTEGLGVVGQFPELALWWGFGRLLEKLLGQS
jgi:hypothetical protein